MTELEEAAYRRGYDRAWIEFADMCIQHLSQSQTGTAFQPMCALSALKELAEAKEVLREAYEDEETDFPEGLYLADLIRNLI